MKKQPPTTTSIFKCQHVLCTSNNNNIRRHMYIVNEFMLWIHLCDAHNELFKKKFKNYKNWYSEPKKRND